ncbi:MAG: TIGR00289 family protein [Candidatus Thermoplasmatota archaeon]
MKIAALFSGGKDSVYAIYLALQKKWEVTCLVTLEPLVDDSWMFHSVNIALTEYGAKALGLPLYKKGTAGQKETELDDLYALLKSLPVDGVISGAIASEYQRVRIERICRELNVQFFAPLWHQDQETLLREMVAAGFSILIVGVFADGFDQFWLGQQLTEHNIDQFITVCKKYKISLAGEGGEYETLVVDAPIFSQKIVIDEAAVDWKRDHGMYRITRVHLEPKK